MKKILAGLLVSAVLFAVPAFAAGPGDYSGLMTLGGTSQEALPVSTGPRNFIFCENPTATASGVTAESVFINWGAAASGTISANTGSIELVNGANLMLTSSNTPQGILMLQFTIVAATTNHRYVCKQG